MKVSVVIPAWNGERYLGEALDSVFGQTRPPFEVIVVDDASADGTSVVASSFPVTLFRVEHGGAAAARNAGIVRATGDAVALLDQDDVWHPEKLERQVEVLEREPSVAVVFAGIESFVSPDVPDVARDVRFTPGVQYAPATSTMLTRRSTFEAVGLLPDLFAAEHVPWLARVRARGLGVQMMPLCLARRRIHETNTSRTRRAEGHKAYFEILRRNVKVDLKNERGDRHES